MPEVLENSESNDLGKQTTEVSPSVLAAARAADAKNPRMTVDEQVSAMSEDRARSEATMAEIRSMLGSPEPALAEQAEQKKAVPFDDEKLDRFANMNADEVRAFLHDSEDKFATAKSEAESQADSGDDNGEVENVAEGEDDTEEIGDEMVSDSEAADSTAPSNQVSSPEAGFQIERNQVNPELAERIKETAKRVKFIKENLGIDFTDPKNEKLLWVDEEEGKNVIDVLYEVATEGGGTLNTDGSIDNINQESIMKIIGNMEGKADLVSDLYEVEVVESDDASAESVSKLNNYQEIKEHKDKPGQHLKFRFKEQG